MQPSKIAQLATAGLAALYIIAAPAIAAESGASLKQKM